MDKLVAIRIKYNDGTYSNNIPLSVLAVNIDWDGTYNLVDVLGNVDLNKGSIQEQINALITTITPDNVQWDLTHTLSDVLGDVDLDKGDLQTQIDNISDGEIQVDSTLTAAGKAADAKAVGDNLKNVVRVGNSNVTNFTSIILGDTAEQVNLLDQSDLIDINTRLSALENGGIQVDQTLSVQGIAADAKATGDAIHNLQGLVGTPLTAAIAASMTNTDKIYVYTGSETGYTNGNWYYYDGTAWVSGGVYNSIAMNMDTVPTSGSSNPVTSGGIKAALDLTSDVLDDVIAERFNRIIEYKYGDEGTVTEDNINFQYNGNIRSSSGYSIFYVQADGDYDAYMSSSPSWHECAIYTDLPFSSATLVESRLTSQGDEFPTFENPMHISAGQYFVVGEKSVVQRSYKVYFVEYVKAIDESKLLVTQKVDRVDKNIRKLTNGAFRFARGGFSRTGGQLGSKYRPYYLIQGDYIQPGVDRVYVASDNYKIGLHAWNNGVWAGFMTDVNTIGTNNNLPMYWVDSIDFTVLRKMYPEYTFRIEAINATTATGTDTGIELSEAENIIFDEYVSDNIRRYYDSEMEKTLNTVRNAITEPSLVFPLITDVHFMSESIISTLFNVAIENIKYLCGKVTCDFIMNLGDNTDGNATPAETMRRNKYMLERFGELHVPYYHAIGNHDTNYYNSSIKLTGQESYLSYLANTKNVHFEDNAYHLSFYKDFDELGIRLLCLNTNYLNSYKLSQDTITWVTTKALDTDYTILLCEHLSCIDTQNWNAQHVDYAPNLEPVLRAFVTNGGTIIQLCGHSHSDFYFNDPWLAVVNCCQKMEQVATDEDGYLEIVGNIGGNAGIVSPARKMGTVTEDLWSVCVMKPQSKEIDIIRFGAGVDRYFHYERTDVSSGWSFATILENVTWSSSDTAVATVSDGSVTAVDTGLCQITATDTDGNFETWTVAVN